METIFQKQQDVRLPNETICGILPMGFSQSVQAEWKLQTHTQKCVVLEWLTFISGDSRENMYAAYR